MKDSPFYRPQYIQVYNSITEVSPAFVLDNQPVDFGYQNEFSPIGLLEHIDDVIYSRSS